MMVGRCISYWNSPFFGGHVNFQGCKVHTRVFNKLYLSRWMGSWLRPPLYENKQQQEHLGSQVVVGLYERFGNGGVCLSKMTWWGWWVVRFLVQIYDIPQIQKWFCANVSCVDIIFSDTLLSWRRVTFKRKNTENETPTGPIGMLTIAKALDKRHLYILYR